MTIWYRQRWDSRKKSHAHQLYTRYTRPPATTEACSLVNRLARLRRKLKNKQALTHKHKHARTHAPLTRRCSTFSPRFYWRLFIDPPASAARRCPNTHTPKHSTQRTHAAHTTTTPCTEERVLCLRAPASAYRSQSKVKLKWTHLLSSFCVAPEEARATGASKANRTRRPLRPTFYVCCSCPGNATNNKFCVYHYKTWHKLTRPREENEP